jgi:hypothetical protein
MPIIKEPHQYNSPEFAAVIGGPKRLFEGRVLRIEKTTEVRNWSDTLDYTDHRSTECTWALVWLGTHGVPPQSRGGRVTAGVETYSWNADQARDLEVHEQYAWIDCTNLFSDRYGYRLEVSVDSFDMQLLHGGPAMLEGVAVWEAFHTARREKLDEEARIESEKRQAIIDAEAAKAAARQAKRDEKLAAVKSAAEGQLARIPAKGTQVTVDGFTGRVFWTGVTKYRGTWNARAGVKDSKGNVVWVEATKF